MWQENLARPLALSLPSRISQRARTSLSSLFAAYINTQIEHQRVLGCDAVSRVVDLCEIAAETVEAALKSRRFDCVVVGA